MILERFLYVVSREKLVFMLWNANTIVDMIFESFENSVG